MNAVDSCRRQSLHVIEDRPPSSIVFHSQEVDHPTLVHSLTSQALGHSLRASQDTLRSAVCAAPRRAWRGTDPPCLSSNPTTYTHTRRPPHPTPHTHTRALPSPSRRVFRQYDPRSRGYVTPSQFFQMLADLCAIDAEDAQSLLPIVDPQQDGRISYHALYHRLYLVGRLSSLVTAASPAYNQPGPHS